MAQTCWPGTPDGRYWIGVCVGNLPLRVMIDLGLVDPRDLVGFELDPAAYDQLRQAGHLSRFQSRSRRDASGRVVQSESGLTTAQLICPITRQCVGPTVQLYVLRGFSCVPQRVGVAFFHRLSGCRVFRDLSGREWCIDCP